MLYIIGVVLVITGIGMFIRFLILSNKRPKVYDARIKNVFKDFWEHPKHPGQVSPNQIKQAEIEYYFESQKYETSIILKSRSKQPGDTLIVMVSTENPRLSEEYSPGREILVCSMITAIGAALAIGSHLAMNYYDAW